jgi:hypothetical protein
MLATAICLERYMTHDLSASSRNAIEKEWVTKWKERLGHPTITPRQVMRTYVDNLDITVADLDNEMDWDCWSGDIDTIPDIADV